MGSWGWVVPWAIVCVCVYIYIYNWGANRTWAEGFQQMASWAYMLNIYSRISVAQPQEYEWRVPPGSLCIWHGYVIFKVVDSQYRLNTNRIPYYFPRSAYSTCRVLGLGGALRNSVYMYIYIYNWGANRTWSEGTQRRGSWGDIDIDYRYRYTCIYMYMYICANRTWAEGTQRKGSWGWVVPCAIVCFYIYMDR